MEPGTSTDARERMIRSAALLFRERGVEGTSFSDVLAHSGAPRGSIYHHFPRGKAELIEETTRYAGDFIAGGLAEALEQKDPAAALRRFAEVWSASLRDSDFAAGCPVVAVALDSELTPAAREAAGAAFGRWEELLADSFEQHGATSERAQSLATLAVASIEGAVVLSRAQRSTEPLDRVAAELAELAATVASTSDQGAPRYSRS
jgi:TetR/AcrR family transcriptional regulator, lmrAB and yxaGH operons repressor